MASRHGLERWVADAVTAHRGHDPLAPLPIVVGGTLMRPYLRRRLAALTGGHLNVRLMTVGELGTRLGHRRLVQAGRRPLPFLADRILAQQVAVEGTGYFDPVAAMPGFPSVLLRTLRELRNAGIDAAAFEAALQNTPDPTRKLQSLATLYSEHEGRRAGFFSSEDGLAVADPDALGAARLIVYGVWEPTALLLAALDALVERIPVAVLLPRATGDPAAALGRFVEWAAAHGIRPAVLAGPEPDERPLTLRAIQHRGDRREPDASVALVSAPDPAREVQEVVAACVRWAQSGISFHDMAVVYRQSEPYRALLEAAFREAGIPTYLHEGTPLTERPLGRRIAALLDLVDGDLERATVMTFLADARLPAETWERYGRVSPTGWDTDSRRAGVVRGAEQWERRLAAARAELVTRYEQDPPPWLPERLARIDGLRTFIADLDAALRGRHERASWQEHLTWLRELLTTYVADAGPVVDALDGLAALEMLSADLSFERFRDAVTGALEGLRAADVLDARAGAFGVRGVALLDANAVRHLGFECVAIVGIAERRFPPPPRQDALLLDHERAELNARHGWSLPLRATGADPEPLQFAVAVEAADRALQLSVPRTQDGETRPVLPSTFLLDAAARVAGEPVRVGDFERVAAEHGRRVRAGRLTAADARDALTEVGYVRALLEDGAPMGLALLRRRLPRYDRVNAAEDAHWTPVYGPHDGVLSEEGRALLEGHAAFARPFAPTTLEDYAKCPQRFFLGRVVGVRRDDEPEELLRISPLDRGNVFHAIVERFMRTLTGRRPQATDRALLSAIADTELARAEAEGLTGHPVFWAGDRAAIREDVERWLEHEIADPDGAALTRADYEVRFGPSRHPGTDGPLTRDAPLVIELSNGEAIEVAGRIDRVDWRDTPAAYRVIDYKTGSARARANRLDGGRALQLPLYLLAAAKALDVDPIAGEAQYFYATRVGEYRRVSFTGEHLADRRGDLDRVLSELHDGMRTGDFHLEPSNDECRYCAFDRVCDARRQAIRRRKGDDPLAVRVDARREQVP
jgi:hypothetical protein